MRYPVWLIIALLVVMPAGIVARAQTPATNPIVIEQAWARATPKGAMTGAAYMTVTNHGASADRLLGATTPLADSVQFHTEVDDNGISRMREVSSVDLAPGATVVFKPREMHMMIVRLKQPLIEGETLPLTLQFENAGNIELTVPIEKIGATQHEGTGGMMQGPDAATQK